MAVVKGWLSRRSDERSIDHYGTTLHRLESAARGPLTRERARIGRWLSRRARAEGDLGGTGVTTQPSRSGDTGASSVARVAQVLSPVGPRGGRRRVRVDRRAAERQRPAPTSSPSRTPFRVGAAIRPVRTRTQARLHALGRVGIFALAVAALAFVIALPFVPPGSRPAPREGLRSHPALARRPAARTSPPAVSASRAPSAQAPSGEPSTEPSTTAAPSSSPAALVPSVSDATDATYQLPSGVGTAPIDVTISAAGPCWVEVLDGGPDGPLLWEGTLSQGDSQNVTVPPASGGFWARLGAPTLASLRVGGAPVTMPGEVTPTNPYDLSFVPAPPGQASPPGSAPPA